MDIEAEFDQFVIDDFGPSVRVQVPSTAEGLARFNQAFLDPPQRAYVQHIDFHIVLPTIGEKRIKKIQSRKEALENDAVFTRAVATFLGRLAKWERRRYGPGINLKIAVESPTDRLVEEMEEDGELKNTHNHRTAPIWQVRDHFRYLRFDHSLLPPSDLGLAKLPQVPCVFEFEFDGGPGGRNFHPDAIAAISSALVSARKMEWTFRLPTRRLIDARREIRSALGNALLNTSFSSLVEFRINLDDKDPMDEAFQLETLMGDDEEADTLSLGVRRLCQVPSLRRLHLEKLWILSPAAFGSQPTLPEIHCPSLEYLYVDCSATTPDGHYLLTGDPSKALADDSGYGLEHDEEIAAFDSDDSDTSDFQPDFEWSKSSGEFPGRWFRYTPEPDAFSPLATSFVSAVDKMPSLRRMDIHFGGTTTTTRAPLDMLYFAPGEPNRGASQINGRKAFDEENASSPRWFFQGGRKFDKEWHPSQELERACRGKSGLGRVHFATN
ncbi:hypothetical protein CORC01_10493 [Colletotrichum orchidophilum]|uniref:F-box domain-containing protein n=1 Tax=Colletotrichum orchidophilum TaxID=1209926 RepID=A0A1G4AYH9_9PEZI|nr:uncharacterized protein CORC01_10493 [Colletotrichum orchidophilum]OHE94155.1 hypothetical protein CORC01_10493 [Colletotrichum orchidophilum]